MTNCVARRRRYHKRLSGLDEGFAVSAQIQANMLLDMAGITEDQKLMVMTSVWNKYTPRMD